MNLRAPYYNLHPGPPVNPRTTPINLQEDNNIAHESRLNFDTRLRNEFQNIFAATSCLTRQLNRPKLHEIKFSENQHNNPFSKASADRPKPRIQVTCEEILYLNPSPTLHYHTRSSYKFLVLHNALFDPAWTN